MITSMRRSLIRVGLVLVAACVVCSPVAAKTKSWKLFHRLSSPGTSSSDWSVRGTIELSDENDDDEVKLNVQNEGLDSELAKALSDGESYYQLKLVEDGGKSPEIFTSVPSCNVRRANFRDEIQLSLQDASARALSLSYMPLVSPLAPATCDEYKSLPEKLEFDTKASWETSVPGMKVGYPPRPQDATQQRIKPPPGLKWIPGASRGSKTKDGQPQQGGPFAGGDPENMPEPGPMGFLKRYWYILLPMLVINFMTAAQPPAEQEAGAAGAAAGTAAVAAASTASPAAGGTPRRRGKRD